MDDYTRGVYTRLPHLKSEAVKAFKASRAAAEDEHGKRVREIMIGNTHEVLMGKMRDDIMLHTTVPYHSTSNGVAERMIGVLTIAVHTGRGWVQVGYLVQPRPPHVRANLRCCGLPLERAASMMII